MSERLHEVTLASHGPELSVYYSALSGHRAHLLEFHDDDAEAQFADSHTTIRLPSRIHHFPDRRQNFDWYKVALTHRAAHYEGGTFDFRYDLPARHYERLLPDDRGLEPYPEETDLEVVFRMFSYRTLAIELFTVLEDLRLDTWVLQRYPGMRLAFARVTDLELRSRPPLEGLSPRGALLELLVRLSLGQTSLPALHEQLHDSARWLRVAVRPLAAAGASVEDTVEATLRVYSLVTRLPVLGDTGGTTRLVQEEDPEPEPEPWIRTWPQADRVRLEGDDILDVPVGSVAYRDALGLRYSRYQSPPPPGQSEILRLTTGAAENEPPAEALPLEGLDTDDGDGASGPPEPLPHDHHEFGNYHFHPVDGSLEARSASEWVYPEWDHLSDRYLPRWARVRERTLPSASSTDFFEDVLRTYGSVLPQLRSHLSQLKPEGLQRVRRLPDGDELDLEAAIQAIADLRAGVGPDEGVYVRQDRVARDVSVAFLLDLSSSTAERLDDGPDVAGPSEAQIRTLHGRSYRRIIDVAKESVALLAAAFEEAGDQYGLFGFSGTGRAAVDFVVIKDFGEPLTNHVASRIDALTPLHTTRMGAAIRHAAMKLNRSHTTTRLLMVVSDGRPFDLDYGQQHGDGAEVDHAIHDTRRALLEARDDGIRPFLLTVDQGGHDYLADLCGDLGYEVLGSVHELPVAVLRLYRDLLRGRPQLVPTN